MSLIKVKHERRGLPIEELNFFSLVELTELPVYTILEPVSKLLFFLPYLELPEDATFPE